MNVELLARPDLTIARYAGRVCTATENIEDDPRAFIEKLIKAGHESVLEHLNYTFEIRDITRGLLQELARHRHVSMSVQSTRWALKKTIKQQTEAAGDGSLVRRVGYRIPKIDFDFIENLANCYEETLRRIDEALEAGVPNDTIKQFLPEGFKTSLVLTTNARELRHILKIRSAPNAYHEFRELCAEMFAAIPDRHRFMFSDCMH